MFAFKRKRKQPDGVIREDDCYTYSFQFRGKQVARKTAFTDKKQALDAARSHLFALNNERFDVANALRLRKAAIKLRLDELVSAYLHAPPAPGRANDKTRRANVHTLKTIVRRVHGKDFDVDGASVSILDGDLIWNFKQKVQIEAAEEDEERRLQLYRSANSLLRQARSLFTSDLLEYYDRSEHMPLPDLTKFREAECFSGAGKFEYHAPGDAIISKTFADLERLRTGDVAANRPIDLNAYKACWLAIGFGLRASEIREARRRWFMPIEGAIWCCGDVLAKNRRFPRVRVQLGAWDQLGPLIEHLRPDEYLIAGSATERSGDVFRRISAWMRNLGWQTQHHVHEFRAWAGCQIAENAPRGIIDAQTFMRHASYMTTETYYGHHMKRRLDEVKMKLPEPAGPLQLKIINGGA